MQGVPLYTDARHYASAGIPTVLYGAGPKTLQEANGHGADECLRLDDLRRRDRRGRADARGSCEKGNRAVCYLRVRDVSRKKSSSTGLFAGISAHVSPRTSMRKHRSH